jgi:hypothetical protein
MKIVKLPNSVLQDWRLNVSHLVDEGGHLVSQLDRPLENALSTVTRSARSQRKSVTQKISIGSGATQREHVIAVAVTRAGVNADDLALAPTIDGHRVVSGREVIAAKMLQEHGECQLRGPNNVIIKVVRDPRVHRPTLAESQQIAPKPDHCPCKNWGSPHPGTHYSTCQWNRLAPPDERAPTDKIAEEEVRLLPTEAFEGLKPRAPVVPQTNPIAAKVDPRAVVVQAVQLDAPDSCRNECLLWATPKGFPIAQGQHHPTCSFYKPWMLKTSREIPRWLVDLHTGEKVRVASDAEIGEADITAGRTGSPIIHVENVPYAVILQTELAENVAPALQATGTGS